jgi:hypothetical protein
VRYLPQSLISDVSRMLAGLRARQSFSAIPLPDPPVIRRGASGTFYDSGARCERPMISQSGAYGLFLASLSCFDGAGCVARTGSDAGNVSFKPF